MPIFMVYSGTSLKDKGHLCYKGHLPDLVSVLQPLCVHCVHSIGFHCKTIIGTIISYHGNLHRCAVKPGARDMPGTYSQSIVHVQGVYGNQALHVLVSLL